MQWPKQLNSSLEEVDPQIADIIELEKARQWKVLFTFFIYAFFFFGGGYWIKLKSFHVSLSHVLEKERYFPLASQQYALNTSYKRFSSVCYVLSLCQL
jgi:hypothetical protein